MRHVGQGPTAPKSRGGGGRKPRISDRTAEGVDSKATTSDLPSDGRRDGSCFRIRISKQCLSRLFTGPRFFVRTFAPFTLLHTIDYDALGAVIQKAVDIPTIEDW